ncbi:unnamed protein product [Brassica oleracea]
MRERQYNGLTQFHKENGHLSMDNTSNATNQGSNGLQHSNRNSIQHSIPLRSVFKRILGDLKNIPVSSGIQRSSQGNLFVDVEPTKKRKLITASREQISGVILDDDDDADFELSDVSSNGTMRDDNDQEFDCSSIEKPQVPSILLSLY